jgi:CRP-like cAMP-binding protein
MPTTTNLFRHIKDPISYAEGEHIFHQDDPADSMFAVIEGEVNIFVQGRLVRACGPGEIFGEMGLIEHQPRLGDAVAKTACKLAKVNEDRFNYMVQQTPNFALTVMRVLSERLRSEDLA